MGILIQGGRIVDAATDTDKKGDIYLEDGVITEIGEKLKIKDKSDKVIDAKGCLVMPGLIDLHVHFRDPGQTQKEDIESLASIYKELLSDEQNGGDDYYLSVFRNHFKPQLNYNGRYMFMISDKDKNIIVDVQGSNLTVEFGQDMEADVIGKMSKETFDRIVQGRITFHRAFMTGDMTAKGNFRTLRMLDEVFNFED